MLGTVKFKNFAAFFEWYIVNGFNWGKEWSVFHDDQNSFNKTYSDKDKDNLSKMHDRQFRITHWYDESEEETKEREQKRAKETLEEIQEVNEYIALYNTYWDLVYISSNDTWAVIEHGMKRFIIPNYKDWLDITFLKNYDDFTIRQLKASTSDKDALMINNQLADVSVNEVKDKLAEQTSKIEQLRTEMNDVKQAKTGELAKLQQEIDTMLAKLNEKKANMLETLNAKMSEFEQMKERLENEIFVLSTEIYAIRCFMGEVVNFTQLRAGIAEKTDIPVVLFQKLRFLDEELGKIASIYDVEWNDHKLFEELIKHNPEVFENFCPSSKCISLVRLSRTGSYIAGSDVLEGLLKRYELYHGKKIGILVRNGENLYLGWTDEDYINFKDDVFYTPGTKEVESNNTSKPEHSSKEEIAGRYLVFSILEGLLQSKTILTLPEGQKFMKPSPYVIYSAAENWLVDNRFGTFVDILKRVNVPVKQGDMILTTLKPYISSQEKNDRGRGYANRTHDCSVSNAKIYPVNLIEYTYTEYFEYERTTGSNYYIRKYYNDDTPKLEREDGAKYVGTVTESHEHVFISCSKYWSSCNAKANVELYDDEYINLTYLNSVWLEYIIKNRTIGDWYIGGTIVDYAYAIKYLKIMLDHVKEREKKEVLLIYNYYPELGNINEWQILLSEWKMEHGVRQITDYQAKRFARYLEKTL